MKSVLVYRFSALGDVLLCYPVLRSVLDLNPNLEITFVTQSFLKPFFSSIPRLTCVGVDVKKECSGLFNIYKLSRQLKEKYQFEAVCDLHQVTRTRLLNLFIGKDVYKVDKARQAKRKFLKNLDSEPLTHVSMRYLKVFKELGLEVPGDTKLLSGYRFESKPLRAELSKLLSPEAKKLGIAPYAKHFTKTWPKQYLEKFLELNEAGPYFQIYLFGGPGEEANYFDELDERFLSVTNLAGQFKFHDEMSLMQAMDKMIVMDSANMHMAALAGVPLLSIWGGTHPNMGFYPLSKQAETLQVDRKQLTCRPCSVFGRPNCPKKHFKCMLDLKPEIVLQKIISGFEEHL